MGAVYSGGIHVEEAEAPRDRRFDDTHSHLRSAASVLSGVGSSRVCD
jgi:hypothetical protein